MLDAYAEGVRVDLVEALRGDRRVTHEAGANAGSLPFLSGLGWMGCGQDLR